MDPGDQFPLGPIRAAAQCASAESMKPRSGIIPGVLENTSEHAAVYADGAPARMSWARFFKRVFDIDIEHCPQCGGCLKIIAAPSSRLRTGVEEFPVIVRILTHLGLPARAPPRAPARRVDLFQAA